MLNMKQIMSIIKKEYCDESSTFLLRINKHKLISIFSTKHFADRPCLAQIDYFLWSYDNVVSWESNPWSTKTSRINQQRIIKAYTIFFF